MHPDTEFRQLDRAVELERKVRRSFDATVLDMLIQQLQESYKIAAEPYDTRLGYCNEIFGNSLYYITVFNLAKIAKMRPDLMNIESHRPLFRLAIGEYKLGAYRVGKSANDLIWTSFPRTDGAPKSMELTSYLPGMEPDLLQSKHIILAHMGNPDDLLCAAYLCIPTYIGQDDRISEWGFVMPVFSEADAIRPTTDYSKPPLEIAKEAVVRKKERKELEADRNA